MFAIIQDDNRQDLALLSLEPKDFKSGSRGFYGNGKINSGNGKRYQATLILTEIGSKPAVVKPAKGK